MCRVLIRNDGAAFVIRLFAALPFLAAVWVAGCGPSYSPDTYATNAAQQANKVDEGVVVGVRPVRISAQGAAGGVAGAAAGGIAGSQVGAGPTSAFGAIGGSVIGGIAGVTAEHIVGDADGFEYIVRKANGDMLSVAQKDPKPLRVGQKVLVIGGTQARVVADYTVAREPPSTADIKTIPPTGGPGPRPAADTSQPPAVEVRPPAATIAPLQPSTASGGAGSAVPPANP
jgi:outer membrane lipoprotein SlyB